MNSVQILQGLNYKLQGMISYKGGCQCFSCRWAVESVTHFIVSCSNFDSTQTHFKSENKL